MKRKNITVGYQLSKEEKEKMIREIERFYSEVREEEIGIIGSQQVLDFFLEVLGGHIYNKALDDANLWYKKMAENMESDFYSLYKNCD